jgi:hypothetical protein
LPVQKRDELIPRRQPAHARIGPVRVHQTVEHMPGHVLQDGVKYAILMPHGVDPLPCPEMLPDVRKTEESTPCALSTKTQPDSRGLRLQHVILKLPAFDDGDAKVEEAADHRV